MLPKKQPSWPTHLLFFVSVLYSFAFSCQKVCNYQEQSSLLAFSGNISISSSFPPLNWSSSISCCKWEGVKCNRNGNVTHLRLPSRGLEGEITYSINSLVGVTNLRIIDLSSNNLSGPIPPSLMNCTNLEEIILRDNYLVGDLSKLDFSRFVQLQKLDLRNNSFGGTFPESIYSCKSLVAIAVSLNNISGQISPRVVELKSLSFLSLSYNSFRNIKTTLGILRKCKNLTTLVLSNNFHGESLPTHRTFVGLYDFPNLQFLYFDSCKFVPGPVPEWLSNLKGLRALYLRDNQMTGKIPDWLGSLPNLTKLELGYNSLSGEFPLKLCQLPALISQNVQENFHFDLPMFAIINGFKVATQYNGPNFYRGLSLSGNTLNGYIPPEIGNLQNLQLLELDNNQFIGHIPVELSKLKQLEVLDLSSNKLTGEIPTSLKELNFLSYLDLSHNNLVGPIPTGGQFDTFQESSFEGNPGLCGEPVSHACHIVTRSPAKDISKSHHLRHLFLDGLFVGLASGFSGVLVIVTFCFWFNYCKRRRSYSNSG